MSMNLFYLLQKKQDEILLGYQKDFVKYADTKDYPKILAVWESIPSQLGKENRKSILTSLDEMSKRVLPLYAFWKFKEWIKKDDI